MTKQIKNESGYSMVEVLVAILILTVAIIPMVGMFDSGIRSATTSGNYDRARAFANQKLEEAKSLDYTIVKNNFPETPPTTTTYNGSGFYQSGWKPTGGNTEYMVTKRFMAVPSNNAAQNFGFSNSDVGLLWIKVTVRWNGGNQYSVTGLVSESE